MRNVGNRTLITILVFLIIGLLALIGYLVYLILGFARGPESEATLYVVDASERMLNNFADTDLSRLEMAQQFVRSNLSDLPDNEITALHVFGSGTEIDGCADTVALVPPTIAGNASTDIQSALNMVQPVSRDAALILGAVRALEALAEAEVNGTSFQGNVTLIIVTGGSGTCLENSELIQLTANRAGFNLELVQINIDADQDEDSGFALVDNARTINIQNPEDLENAGEELNNDGATVIASGTEQAPPVLNPPTQENTATSFPTATPTTTSTPIPPTPVPTSTPVPTEPPTSTPVPATATISTFGTATQPAAGIQTSTPTQPPPTATFTPPPTATPSTVSTSPPVVSTATRTPIPTSTPTQDSGSGSSPTSTPPPTPTWTPVPNSPVTIYDATVTEGGRVEVVVERLTANSRTVIISYRTIDVDAVSPADFTQIDAGEIRWESGISGRRSIFVDTIDDGNLEPTETFQVLISSNSGADIQKSLAVVTIQDNDIGSINVGQANFNVSEASNTTQTSLTLSNPPSAPVNIGLSSTNSAICSVPSQITLDGSNWNNNQLVINIANNNEPNRANGSSSCQIITAPATSGDTNFAGLDAADLNITVIDDDAQYVDQTCPDGDNNEVCDNGFFFRTITAALSSPIPADDIYVLSSPHTETNILIGRNVNIISSNPANAILQGAGTQQAANGRIFNISAGVNVSLVEFTIQNGFAQNGDGGAIENQGNLTLNKVNFVGNVTSNSGGAIFNIGSLDIINESSFETNNAQNGCGGAIFNSGQLTVNTDQNSSLINFAGNQASGGSGAGGALCNASGGTAALNRTLMVGNRARNQGGAIYNQGGTIVVENSFINGNQAEAGSGGGLYNVNGTLVVQSSYLTGNTASSIGGGVHNDAGATFRLLQSSLTFNGAGGDGGAIYNDGELVIQNGTLSTNNASGSGGALRSAGGTANLDSVTINDNTASNIGGVAASTQTTLHNSVINNSSGGDCSGVISANFVLISAVGSCTVNGNNNLLNVGASLQPLSDNGSGIQAHPPNAGSPVLGAGDPNNCLPTDQWGSGRPSGGNPNCDLGAIEQ